MLLLSIHPKHVDAILSGTKQVELRRRKPHIQSGPALIYATSPRMELAARVHVTSVVRAPLGMLWRSVREVAGVSRREFYDYLAGLDSGVAIWLSDVKPIRSPIPLSKLRTIWQGFQPPQGFCYLNPPGRGFGRFEKALRTIVAVDKTAVDKRIDKDKAKRIKKRKKS